MIKAVIFDCFGVLTTDTWRAFLATLPPHTDFKIARRLNHQRDSGILEHQDFLEKVYELTGKYPQEVESMDISKVVKNTALLEYIKELKKDYKIGLLSNVATNWIRSKFLSIEEQGMFDQMVLSYETGMTKPDPAIYMLMCDRLGVAPFEAVMIDDVSEYCEAAKNQGMQAIQYNDFPQMKADLKAILSLV